MDTPPAGVERFEGRQPSGCSFWRLAADGKIFYTMPENHFNCAMGAYTHNITLSPDREPESGLTLNMMFDLGYVRPEEVPQIPRLPKQPAAVVYSLLGDAPVQADAVLFACQPRVAMHGSARVAATRGDFQSRLRREPRVSGLGEDQMYFVLRGKDLDAVAGALEVVINANVALSDYARDRRHTLSTA